MARQYKKILKKIHPKPKKWQTEQPKEKYGRDYLLLAVIGITIFFMLVGWANFTIVNKVLYIMLAVALSTTYARRHYDFTEKQDYWVVRISYVAMGIATAAFLVNVYQNFFS